MHTSFVDIRFTKLVSQAGKGQGWQIPWKRLTALLPYNIQVFKKLNIIHHRGKLQLNGANC